MATSRTHGQKPGSESRAHGQKPDLWAKIRVKKTVSVSRAYEQKIYLMDKNSRSRVTLFQQLQFFALSSSKFACFLLYTETVGFQTFLKVKKTTENNKATKSTVTPTFCPRGRLSEPDFLLMRLILDHDFWSTSPTFCPCFFAHETDFFGLRFSVKM